MEEIIICVDENDNEVGYIEKMDAHIKGILHRALSVFIFNEKKDVYKRQFLGLADKANNYPCELSGGQKQRVAIGRALALNPKLMCFDEPTSALDPSLTKDIATLIKSLSKKGMSMLIITHDMEFAKLVSNKIISMDSGVIIDKHIYNDKIEISSNTIS